VLYKQGLLVDLANIVVILELAPPTSNKQPRETLGYTRYYKNFIKSYEDMTTPMEKLLKKESKFQWNEEYHKGLDTLK
jgi:hypothetical protein